MIPISTQTSPAYLLDLVYRLKIRDVMTSKVVTAEPQNTLRDIQKLMRENRISGVPILDQFRLVGMVSVDDIIRALDQGYIEAYAEKHMAKKIIVLEDDMPLSFGISYFEKYKFGRFPVINKDRELVGIVTSRDVTVGLLMEMNQALEKMESEINQYHKKLERPDEFTREFIIRKFDYENAGRASTEMKKLLNEKGVPKAILRNIAVASYELEMNLVNHSEGGRMIFTVTPQVVTIDSLDTGPGIPDIEKAMTEGFSTANDWIRSLGFGAGMGLPNTKRVSDEFSIESEVGKGTHVQSRIFLTPQEGP